MNPVRNKLFFHDSPGKIKNFMGVELEISNFNSANETELIAVLNKWKANCGSDGSIQPYGEHPNSFEIKTAPARGEAFTKQLTEICAILVKGKAKANESCGLHVHIDARAFTPDDLLKVALVWPKIENKFWTKTYGDRQESGYCDSWGKIIHINERNSWGTDTFKAGTLLEMYDQVREVVHGERMMTLNFTALAEHGTIENRMHHGTVNLKTILAWATLNDRFINKARRMSINEAMNFTTPNAILRTKKKDPLKRKTIDDKLDEIREAQFRNNDSHDSYYDPYPY